MILRTIQRTPSAILVIILATALLLRLFGLFWDGGQLFHPDERWILTVASQLHGPRDGNWHTLDPFWDPDAGHLREFAYGHFPLYALRLSKAALNRILPLAGTLPARLSGLLGAAPSDDLERLAVTGRVLMALTGTATVAMLYALGRRLYDTQTGLLAAALLAVAVLPIQLAHFYTVDPWATFFGVAAVWGTVRLSATGRRRDALLAGGAMGLAVGCKLTMILLVVPLLAALAGRQSGREKTRTLALALAAAGTAFLLTNPFALLDTGMFLESMAVQWGVVHGWLDYPYTRQYHDTLPFIYPLVQQWRWALGPLISTAGWAGVGWTTWRAWQRTATRGELIVLAWVVPFFLLTGGQYAKFNRYLLPIIPFLCLMGARLLTELSVNRRLGRFEQLCGRILTATVLAGSIGYALTFAQIYRQPHPWVRVSAWVYAHVPAGSTIAIEHWDQALPVNLIAGGQVLDHNRYRQPPLALFDLEDEGRFDALAEQLAQSDYVLLASRRLYGTLARWPERYPRTARYYRLLFSGELGFRLVHAEVTTPQLGSFALREDPIAGAGLPLPAGWPARAPARWTWSPGRADESFAVYDHPTPLVFQRVEKLSVQELHRRLADTGGGG